MTFRQRLVRRIPPIAWRDVELARRRDRIKELTAHTEELDGQIAQLRTELDRRALEEDSLARPSFRRLLLSLRRTSVDLRAIDREQRHPLRQLPFKLRNYRFAASHGFAVPEVYRTWSDPGSIDLEGLPDSFVVKSDGGAGSHGVLPLRRTGEDVYETFDGERTLTGEQVRQHFAERTAASRISGPFFAEEALRQLGGGPIPDDIKLYVTYGEVHQVLVRRVAVHGDLRSTSRRYLAADGSDLGDAVRGETVDPSLPVPAGLAEMVGVARHLSLAVGLPFVRVDVYDTDRGIVLGEVTRAPGGRQQVRHDHDELMGRAWEAAAYRLDLDLLAGRPPGLLHGDRPAPNLYPEGHVSRSADPGAWEPLVVKCGTWCALPRD